MLPSGNTLVNLSTTLSNSTAFSLCCCTSCLVISPSSPKDSTNSLLILNIFSYSFCDNFPFEGSLIKSKTLCTGRSSILFTKSFILLSFLSPRYFSILSLPSGVPEIARSERESYISLITFGSTSL